MVWLAIIYTVGSLRPFVCTTDIHLDKHAFYSPPTDRD